MEETLDVEAKSHVEMFHHYFFTLAPDDKYIKYTMEKAMYLIDETGLAQYNALKEKGFYGNIMNIRSHARAGYGRLFEASPKDGEQSPWLAYRELENSPEQGYGTAYEV